MCVYRCVAANLCKAERANQIYGLAIYHDKFYTNHILPIILHAVGFFFIRNNIFEENIWNCPENVRKPLQMVNKGFR